MAKPMKEPDAKAKAGQRQVNGARKPSGNGKKPPPAKPHAVNIRLS